MNQETSQKKRPFTQNGRIFYLVPLVAALIPFFANDYLQFMVNMILVYVLVTVGFNLVIGNLGQLAFANTIEATIRGANCVDASFAGLGRGAPPGGVRGPAGPRRGRVRGGVGGAHGRGGGEVREAARARRRREIVGGVRGEKGEDRAEVAQARVRRARGVSRRKRSGLLRRETTLYAAGAGKRVVGRVTLEGSA